MIEFREDRMEYYGNVAAMAGHVAEGYGIDLSQQTMDRYRLAFHVIALTDDTWDRGTDEDRENVMSYWAHHFGGEIETAPGQVLPALVENATALREQITAPQARQFYMLGTQAVSLATACVTETSAFRYGRLTNQEAKITADMLDAVVTPEDRSHPAYPRYSRCIRRIASAGNAIDTVYDLPKDYRNGEVQVKPTILNMGIIACAAIPDALAGLAGTRLHTIGVMRMTMQDVLESARLAPERIQARRAE